MIRTVTYDTATHKIVPIEPTEAMIIAKPKPAGIEGQSCHSQIRNADIRKYQAMVKAAPEYQEPDRSKRLKAALKSYIGCLKLSKSSMESLLPLKIGRLEDLQECAANLKDAENWLLELNEEKS